MTACEECTSVSTDLRSYLLSICLQQCAVCALCVKVALTLGEKSKACVRRRPCMARLSEWPRCSHTHGVCALRSCGNWALARLPHECVMTCTSRGTEEGGWGGVCACPCESARATLFVTECARVRGSVRRLWLRWSAMYSESDLVIWRGNLYPKAITCTCQCT
jgi:hypothetical protein